MIDRDALVQQALALPTADRAYLVNRLVESLGGDDALDMPTTEQWSAEIDRRLAAHDRGEIRALDVDAVIRHAEQALADHRRNRGS